MASGFDELVQRLLYDVALSGSLGFGINDVEKAARSFCDERNAQSKQQQPGDEEVDVLFSEAPPVSRVNVDDALIEAVWTWLSKHDDIRIEPQETENANGNTQPEEEGTNSVNSKHANERLFTSEDRMWHAIAGHGVDLKRIPLLEFQCLSVIASHGQSGVLQPHITKITGQQKQSVPKRTDLLAQKGYITKKTVLATGTKTSLCILKKFDDVAPSAEDAKKHKDNAFLKDHTGRLIIDYDKWFDATMKLLRAQPNQILALQDLRIHFNIHKKKYESRCLMRCVRRLARAGCVRKCSARPTDGDGQHTLGKDIRCIQLTREPTMGDKGVWKQADKAERHRSSGLIDGELAFPEDQDAGMGDIEAEIDEEDEADDMDEGTERVPPQWKPDMPMVNLLHDIIDEGGVEGVSSMELNARVAAGFMHRPLDEQMSRLTDIWQHSQPSHLRHLSIVRDTKATNRTTHYQFRTLPNFEQAVEEGSAHWESIKDANSRIFKGKEVTTGPPTLPPQELDQWRFPKPSTALFTGEDGQASLAESARPAQRGALVRRNVDNDRPVQVRAPGVKPRAKPGPKPGPKAGPKSGLNMGPVLDANGSSQTPDKMPNSRRVEESAAFTPATAQGPNRLTAKPLKQPRVPPEKDQAEFQVWVDATAMRIAQARKDDANTALRQRSDNGEPNSKRRRTSKTERTQLAEGDEDRDTLMQTVRAELLSRSKPGIYINPPGARDLKAQYYYERGRPKNALIAVAKSPRLVELEFFRTSAPLIRKRASDEMEEDAAASPVPKRPKRLTNADEQADDGGVAPMQAETEEAEAPEPVNTASVPLAPADRRNGVTVPERSEPADEPEAADSASAVTATGDVKLLKPAAEKEPTFIKAYVMKHPHEQFRHVGHGRYKRVSRPTEASGMDQEAISATSTSAQASGNYGNAAAPSGSQFENFYNSYVDAHPNKSFHHAEGGQRKRGNKEGRTPRRGAPSSSGKQATAPTEEEHAQIDQSSAAAPSASHQKVDVSGGPSLITGGNVMQEDSIPATTMFESPTREPAAASSPAVYTPFSATPGLTIVRPYSGPTTPKPMEVSKEPVSTSNTPALMTIVRPYHRQTVVKQGTGVSRPSEPEASEEAQESQYELNESSQHHNSAETPAIVDGPPALPASPDPGTPSATPLPARWGKRHETKAGTQARSGNVPHQRTSLIFDVIEQCGGVYPGNKEMWYPFATAWFKLYRQTPDRRTVDQSVKGLIETGKIKKLTFSFRSEKGENVTRSVLTLKSVEPNSVLVEQMKEAIIEAHPHFHLPREVDISDELRARVFNHPVGRGKTYPPGGQDMRHYKHEFPTIEGLSVQRTTQSLTADGRSTGNVAKRRPPRVDENGNPVVLSRAEELRARNRERQREWWKRHGHENPRERWAKAKREREARARGEEPNEEEYVEVKGGLDDSNEREDGAVGTPSSGKRKQPLRRVRRSLNQRPDDTEDIEMLEDSAPTSPGLLTRSGARKQEMSLARLPLSQPRGQILQLLNTPSGTYGTLGAWLPGIEEIPDQKDQVHAIQLPLRPTQELHIQTGTLGTFGAWMPGIDMRHDILAPAQPISSIGISAGKGKTYDSDYVFRHPERDFFHVGNGRYKASKELKKRAQKAPQPKTSSLLFDKAYVQGHPDEHFVHIGAGRYRRGEKGEKPPSAVQTSRGKLKKLAPAAREVSDSTAEHVPEASNAGPYRNVDYISPAATSHGPDSPLVTYSYGSWTDAAPTQGHMPGPRPPLASLTKPTHVYKSRKRKADAQEAPTPPAKRLSATDLNDLVIALSIVKTLCAGLSQMRLNWDIVAHALSFKFDADTLKVAWASHSNERIEEVEDCRECIRDPFLLAYEQGELPSIDFSDLGSSDWPALFQWCKKQVQAPNSGQTSPAAAQDPEQLDSIALPTSSDALVKQYNIENALTAEPVSSAYFTGKTDIARNSLALSFAHGIPAESDNLDTTTDSLLVVRSWCRAVAATKTELYHMQAAAQKLIVYGDDILQLAVNDLIAADVLTMERKDRQQPGRNFYLTKSFFRVFSRWPRDDETYLRNLAAARERVIASFGNSDTYPLNYHAPDAEALVLTNMAAHGQLKVLSALPDRNDDFSAPWPKLSAWGIGDPEILHNSHEYDPNRVKFPVIYEKTVAFAPEHGLQPAPIPTYPITVDGECTPLWIDIHGNFNEKLWTMVLGSVLHLVVYRTGITAIGIEKAHDGKLWLWEIQMVLKWMEDVGIALRFGPGKENEGVWLGGWRASEWWYCAFAADIATW